MKIDITSMFFNSRIEGQTATPAWGTSIGQNKSRACRIDDFKSEVVDMVIGMTYKSVADIDKLDVSKGSGNRDIITCSVFEDVYINNQKIDNTQYVLLLVREHSKSHDGRLLISYAPYIKYNGIENQSCIELMQQLLGCSAEGCWFVYDISIKNQSELYFSAVVVNPSSPMVYSNSIKSKNRSEEWKALIPSEGESESGIKNSILDTLQQIFYGAPGTGKSFKIKKQTKEKSVIRTTFHPDSDYSTFVGAYKPVMEDCDVKVTPIVTNNGVSLQPSGTYKDRRIAYKFVKQAFLKAYLGAWKKYADREGEEAAPQYLIIEEINRGNCAQIFGDLFQLLDRSANGFSEYPIEADTDMQDAIKNAFAEEDEYKMESLHIDDVIDNYISNYGSTLSDDVREGRVLLLPKNLYIWATMNTSDQSLFPIDSAFKRRWDWEYMPIGYKNDTWTIKIGTKEYNWVDFQRKINEKIYDVDNSEDKQLGDYFVNADRTGNEISSDTLLNKILFYLWNDVCKDDPDIIFKWVDDKDDNKEKSIKFSDFFREEKVRKLQGFMAFLGINANGDAEGKEEKNDDTTAGNDDVVNS